MKADFPDNYNILIEYLDSHHFVFPQNDISMNNYEYFYEIYKRINRINKVDDVLTEIKVRFKRNITIINDTDQYYVINNGYKKELKGWGKLMVYFSESTNGNDLYEYVVDSGQIPLFSKNEIKKAIFYLVLQGLYVDKCLEIC